MANLQRFNDSGDDGGWHDYKDVYVEENILPFGTCLNIIKIIDLKFIIIESQMRVVENCLIFFVR